MVADGAQVPFSLRASVSPSVTRRWWSCLGCLPGSMRPHMKICCNSEVFCQILLLFWPWRKKTTRMIVRFYYHCLRCLPHFPFLTQVVKLGFLPFQLNSGITDKKCIYSRRAMWWFDECIHCELSTIKLINIPVSTHSYHLCVCVCVG